MTPSNADTIIEHLRRIRTHTEEMSLDLAYLASGSPSAEARLGDAPARLTRLMERLERVEARMDRVERRTDTVEG